jgi:hypothetical protein
MLALQIAVLVVCGTLLALFLYSSWKNQGSRDHDVSWEGPVAELETRMEQLELRWVTTRDELQRSMEVGQEAWRKVRQREGIQKRRDALQEEEEEDHEPQLELEPTPPPPDARGLGFGDQGSAPWQDVAKAYARQIAGGGEH